MCQLIICLCADIQSNPATAVFLMKAAICHGYPTFPCLTLVVHQQTAAAVRSSFTGCTPTDYCCFSPISPCLYTNRLLLFAIRPSLPGCTLTDYCCSLISSWLYTNRLLLFAHLSLVVHWQTATVHPSLGIYLPHWHPCLSLARMPLLPPLPCTFS